MKIQIEVKPGQIWKSTDKRRANRSLQILNVNATHAYCQTLPLSKGKQTVVKLERFRVPSKGYALDIEATDALNPHPRTPDSSLHSRSQEAPHSVES